MSGMVLATGELWKSGTFWAAVAALAGVAAAVAAALTAVVTQRVGAPVRRLVYGIRSQAPLLTASHDMHDALEVRHHGQVVTDPYVVTVVLEGRGRRDIPRNAFDNGAPLRLDFGMRIIELLQITHDNSTSVPTPPIAVDGTAVAIGPGLIGRRQKVAFTALVEGEPTLSCDAPLADVSVRPYIPEELTPLLSWRFAAGSGAGAVAVITVIAVVVTAATGVPGIWAGAAVGGRGRR